MFCKQRCADVRLGSSLFAQSTCQVLPVAWQPQQNTLNWRREEDFVMRSVHRCWAIQSHVHVCKQVLLLFRCSSPLWGSSKQISCIFQTHNKFCLCAKRHSQTQSALCDAVGCTDGPSDQVLTPPPCICVLLNTQEVQQVSANRGINTHVFSWHEY